jgi:hypothetical protein
MTIVKKLYLDEQTRETLEEIMDIESSWKEAFTIKMAIKLRYDNFMKGDYYNDYKEDKLINLQGKVYRLSKKDIYMLDTLKKNLKMKSNSMIIRQSIDLLYNFIIENDYFNPIF